MPKTYLFNGLPGGISNKRSIDLSGVEYYRDATLNFLGISTTWTMSFWVKPTTVSSGVVQLLLLDSSVSKNEVGIRFANHAGVFEPPPYDDIEVNLVDDAAAVNNGYRYYNVVDINVWQHFCFTWDSSVAQPNGLKLYKDGVLQVPDDVIGSGGGTYLDTTRSIWWGGWQAASPDPYWNMNGLMGPMAWWDTVLDSANVTEVYNPSTFLQKPFDMDLTLNQGNYDQAANLINWWQQTDVETGETDQVGSFDMDDSVDISLADISTDVPG